MNTPTADPSLNLDVPSPVFSVPLYPASDTLIIICAGRASAESKCTVSARKCSWWHSRRRQRECSTFRFLPVRTCSLSAETTMRHPCGATVRPTGRTIFRLSVPVWRHPRRTFPTDKSVEDAGRCCGLRASAAKNIKPASPLYSCVSKGFRRGTVIRHRPKISSGSRHGSPYLKEHPRVFGFAATLIRTRSFSSLSQLSKRSQCAAYSRINYGAWEDEVKLSSIHAAISGSYSIAVFLLPSSLPHRI